MSLPAWGMRVSWGVVHTAVPSTWPSLSFWVTAFYRAAFLCVCGLIYIWGFTAVLHTPADVLQNTIRKRVPSSGTKSFLAMNPSMTLRFLHRQTKSFKCLRSQPVLTRGAVPGYHACCKYDHCFCEYMKKLVLEPCPAHFIDTYNGRPPLPNLIWYFHALVQ